MKKILTALHVFMIVSCMSCHTGNNNPPNKTPSGIVKIKISDRTDLDYCMNGMTFGDTVITDAAAIKTFQVQLDSMKEVQNMNIGYSFGFYEIILYHADGTQENTSLICTVYDGVVFYNYSSAKAFKNNRMEKLVRKYFSLNHHKQKESPVAGRAIEPKAGANPSAQKIIAASNK
jgi:hypothetical protein